MKASQEKSYQQTKTDSRWSFLITPKIFRAMIIIGLLAVLIMTIGCTDKGTTKPLSLGCFKKISNLSISADGNQLLFTGCGHKDFKECTLYRYEIDSGKLYRYMPRSSGEMFHNGRFSPNTSCIAFSVIPYDANGQTVYDDMQVALAGLDGSNFRIITNGTGVKLRPAISPDEQNLVYFKGRIREGGSPLSMQKRKATGFDLYKLNLATGKETQLTRLEFYETSDPYFTPDGKGVVFKGDHPMRLPHTDNIDEVKQFRDTYKHKHNENYILQYPLDGSGINRLPEPLFSFDGATRIPVVTNDGSVWFEASIGVQRFIHFYRRFSDGTLKEFGPEMLGKGREGKSLVVLFELAATPDGSKLAILNANQDTHQLFIRIFNTKAETLFDIAVPAIAENIIIQ